LGRDDDPEKQINPSNARAIIPGNRAYTPLSLAIIRLKSPAPQAFSLFYLRFFRIVNLPIAERNSL
jgi:hypothetical protein